MSGKRFLLVEDEPLVALLLSEMVQEIGHVVAHEAGILEKALEIAAQGDFDAAVLDANLHGKEAFAIAELLTATGKPFFFSTGYSSDQLPEPWSDHCVMNKPFSFDQLKGCIDGLFPEPSGAAPSIVGDSSSAE